MSISKKSRFIGIVLFCVAALLALPLFAGDADEVKSVFNNSFFRKAEFEGEYLHLLNLAHRHTGSPLARIALKMATELDHDYFKDPSTGIGILEKIAESGNPDPLLKLMALEYLARRMGEMGKINKASGYLQKITSPKSWKYVAGFGEYQRINFIQHYPPDDKIDFNAKYEQFHGESRWVDYRIPEWMPSLSVKNFVFDLNNVFYLYNEFEVVEDIKVLLYFAFGGAYEFHLDGKKMSFRNPDEKENSNNFLKKIELHKGRHFILIKAMRSRYSADALRLAFFDPKTKIGHTGVHFTAIKDYGNKPVTGFSEIKYVDECAFSRCIDNSDSVDQNRPYRCLAEAYAALFNGMNDKASYIANKLIKLHGDDPVLLLRSAILIRDYATNYYRDYVRAVFCDACSRAYDLDERFIRAYYELAAFHKVKKTESALELIGKARNLSGANPVILSEIFLLYGIKGWNAEQESIASLLHKKYPKCPITSYRLYGSALEQKRYYEATHFLEKYVESKKSIYVFNKLARLYFMVGDKNKLDSLIIQWKKLFSHQPRSMYSLAVFLHDKGRDNDALRVMQDNVLPYSTNNDWLEFMGDLRISTGDKAGAMSAFSDSVKTGNASHTLMLKIGRLQSEGGRFWESHDIDNKVAIDFVKNQKIVGSYCRPLDLGVVKFLNNGGYSMYTHNTWMILDRRGGSKLDNLKFTGRLLDTGNILPNGLISYPLFTKNSKEVKMPRLVVGACPYMQYCYNSSPDKVRINPITRWFFRDSKKTQYYGISQLTAIVPDEFPFVFSVKENGTKISFEQEQLPGRIIYRWRAENMPYAFPDAESVDPDEFLPHIVYGRKISWREVGNIIADEVYGKDLATVNVRELANSLCAECKNDTEKIAAIYNYVCSSIVNEQAYMVNSILSENRGNRNIALLAMLKSQGIKAYYVAVRKNTGFAGVPDWAIPDPNLFNLRFITVIDPTNGKYIWLDTRYDYMKPNVILDDVQDSKALVIKPNGSEMVTIDSQPISTYATYSRITIAVSDDNQQYICKYSQGIPGIVGEQLKDYLRHKSLHEIRNYLERRLAESFIAPTVDSHSISLNLSSRKAYRESCNFSAESGLIDLKDSTAVKIPFAKLLLRPIKDWNPNNRKVAYHMRRYVAGTDIVRIEGLNRVSDLPKNFLLTSKFGVYQLKFAFVKGTLIASRKYEFKPQRVSTDQMPKFLETVKKIESAENHLVYITINDRK